MRPIIILFLVSCFLCSCVDTSTIDDSSSNLDTLRIPLGSCSEFLAPAETFSGIYNDLLNQSAGSSSKGCQGSGCHNLATGSGGWSFDSTNAANAHAQIVNRTGASGKTLVTPNSLSESNIVVRISQIANNMPLNGDLWFKTDIDRLKRWVCQGALNN